MKRLLPLFLLALTLTLIVAPFAYAAGTTPPVKAADKSPAAPLATALSTVTGMAISPLLGTGAYGAYQWVAAKDEAARAKLPWFARWSFFGPALLIVGACAAKDAFGAVVPPGLKKPLDVLETVENKASGLVAAGAVVPFTMASVSSMITSGSTAATGSIAPSSFAMIHFATIDFSWTLNLLTVPFGIAMFAIVWMASHAITVLILLSPWGAIDAALKTARTGLLGLLTLTATINPWVGALLSLIVIVVAYLVAGWAFRLTVYGTLFSWDFFTLRKLRFKVAAVENKMFAGGNLPAVPVRSYGRLCKTETGLTFVYRPWLVLPEKTAMLPKTGLVVGKGLFFSTVLSEGADTFFLLPPRYRGHEEELVQTYAMNGVQPAGLRKAWNAIKELFGGGAAKAQIA